MNLADGQNKSREIMVIVLRLSLLRAFAIGAAVLLSAGGTAVAQAPATTPLAYPSPQLTLAEARAIIDGAIAYARGESMRMAVVVVDHAGNVVSSDRMDGAGLQNIRFAEGKAFASALTGKPRRCSASFIRPGPIDTSAS